MKYTAEIEVWADQLFEVQYEYPDRVLIEKVFMIDPPDYDGKLFVSIDLIIQTKRRDQTMYSFIREKVEEYHQEHNSRGYLEEADIQFERERDGA